MNKPTLPRRTFLKTAAVSAAGFHIVPSHVLGRRLGHIAPSDKLNIAGIGVGGKGRVNLEAMNTENIVALCDVDDNHAAKIFNKYSQAARYRDFRKMLEKEIESLRAENAELLQKFNELDAELIKKVDQLQQLMDDLLDEETKKLFEELKKLLEDTEFWIKNQTYIPNLSHTCG